MPALALYFFSPFRHRTLFRQFIRREILGRYRGSLMGLAWAFVTPLVMLGVYTFVFVGVFRMRWPGAEEAGGMAYALRLFAGLIVFNLFSEVISRSPSLIVEQPNLVKKVIFPLELLSWVSLGAALFHFVIGTTILILCAIAFETPRLTMLFAPFLILPLLPYIMGLSWLLSALGVYLRDLGQIIALAVNLMLFLSPVFYAANTLPEGFRFWMELNPLTFPIESLRQALFFGNIPDFSGWLISMGSGLAVALLGAWAFSATRSGFSDVL